MLVPMNEIARHLRMPCRPYDVARDLGVTEHLAADWRGEVCVPDRVAADAMDGYRARQAEVRAEKAARDRAHHAALAEAERQRDQAALEAGTRAAHAALEWGEKQWHLIAAGVIHRAYYGEQK